MSKIKYFILQQVFPGYYAIYVNKLVSKKYDEQQLFDVDLSAISIDKEVSSESSYEEYINQVKTDLKEQSERKKIIEDKAKSLLSIIAVSITAMTFSLNYLNSIDVNFYQFMVLIIIGISACYFAFGAIRAIQTLNIRRFNVFQTEIENTPTSFKLSLKKTEEEFLKELIKGKKMNDLIIVQLSNYAYASFNLIRNGIILFVIFFITTIFLNAYSKKKASNGMLQINKEIQMKINDSIEVKIPYMFELQYDLKNIKIDKRR